MSTHLEALVIDRCHLLGDAEAANYFGVSTALIRQWVNGSKRPSLAAVEKVFIVPEGKSEDPAWEGKEVFICLPQYKTTNPVTLLCLLGMFDRAKFGVLMDYGDAFVIRTREAIAHRFLQTGKKYSFWLDDDMICPMGNAAWYQKHSGIPLADKYAGLHTINRLRSHEKSIIGGLYFGRHPFGRAMYYEAIVDSPEGAKENAWAHGAPYDSLRPVKWAATGCLWVERQVFLDIMDHHPHLAPTYPTEPFHFFTNASDGAMTRFDLITEIVAHATQATKDDKRDDALKHLGEVQRLIVDARNDNAHTAHLMQGEDQTFGHRAKRAGHQSFVDMSLICGHIGSAVYSVHNTGKLPSPRHQHHVLATEGTVTENPVSVVPPPAAVDPLAQES